VGDVCLEVRDLNNAKLKNINFTLRRGEILGFAGLVGAGRTEVARAIYGADRILSGRLKKNGETFCPANPRDGLKHGIGLIPEDRKRQGLILGMSVKENTVFSIYDKCTNTGVIQKSKVESG